MCVISLSHSPLYYHLPIYISIYTYLSFSSSYPSIHDFLSDFHDTQFVITIFLLQALSDLKANNEQTSAQERTRKGESML